MYGQLDDYEKKLLHDKNLLLEAQARGLLREGIEEIELVAILGKLQKEKMRQMQRSDRSAITRQQVMERQRSPRLKSFYQEKEKLQRQDDLEKLEVQREKELVDQLRMKPPEFKSKKLFVDSNGNFITTKVESSESIDQVIAADPKGKRKKDRQELTKAMLGTPSMGLFPLLLRGAAFGVSYKRNKSILYSLGAGIIPLPYLIYALLVKPKKKKK